MRVWRWNGNSRIRLSFFLWMGLLIVNACQSGPGSQAKTEEPRPSPKEGMASAQRELSAELRGPTGTASLEGPPPSVRPAAPPPQPPMALQKTPERSPQPAAPSGSTGSSSSQENVKVLQRDPAGCTWVEAVGTASFGQNDTRHQAKAQAVSDARAKAIEGFLGIKVQDRFMNFQQENSLKGQVQLTESLLRVTQLGRILKEKVLKSGPQDLGDCAGCQFTAHIQTCIVPLSDSGDKDFQTNLTLNRATFVDGDEGVMQVTVTKDAYVYLYSVELDWNAGLLFPNDYASDNHLKAGETLTFPSEELRRKGQKVLARLPAGAKVSAEMMRVIVSKVPLPRDLYDPRAQQRERATDRAVTELEGTGSFLNLLHKLHRSDIEWIEDAQAFTIHQR
ncbi:MAG: DUF4384 domain-containing protein [Nitrospirae bacterium]|nr:DUF4384 domain-containing protein [Nitrospirota bacterium]